MRPSFVIILLAVVFFIGVNAGSLYRLPTIAETIEEAGISSIITKIGFTESNVTIRGNTVSLLGGCRLLQFDVTQDQAYSIAAALTNTSSQRPLTHDIFKEVLDNFNITILQIKIDRREDEIYKATIYMRRGNDLLSIDARPSDAIAMAARYGMPLYVKDTILTEKGTNVC